MSLMGGSEMETRPTGAALDQATRLLLTGGVVGPPLFVVVLLIEGATRPGYSAWRYFGSALALSNQGWEQIANFIVCGLLILGFAVGLRRVLRHGKAAVGGPILLGIYGLGLVIAGILVTDPSGGYPPGTSASGGPHTLHGNIHALMGAIVFITLASACFVLARRFAGDPNAKGWALYSILSGVLVLVFFVASLTPAALQGGVAGLLQRVAIVVGWGWVALLAARLLRQVPASVPPARSAAKSDASSS
jgi:hypothetical protein